MSMVAMFYEKRKISRSGAWGGKIIWLSRAETRGEQF